MNSGNMNDYKINNANSSMGNIMKAKKEKKKKQQQNKN